LLLRKLRGLSSYVGMNVEILLSRILKFTDSKKVCRKLCREFVSTREFCEGKTITTVCAFKNSLAKGR
jgi:hypothetical protein